MAQWFALLAVSNVTGAGTLQRLISSVLLLYAIWVGYAVFLGLSVMGQRKTSRMFMAILLLLIVGSLLELYGGLRPVSDAFRRAANTWRAIYDSDARDLSNYGGLRPNFFASEPSVLGILAGYSLLFWFLSSSTFRSRRLAIAAVLAMLAFAIIRSPTVLVCLAAVVFFYFSERFAGPKLSRARCAALGSCALLLNLLAPVMIAATTEYGQTGSFLLRALGPPIVAGAVLQDSPLFGVGLGGREALMKGVLSGYSSSGAFAQFPHLWEGAVSGTMSTNHLITNQFWEFWIYFGLAGGVLMIFAIWRVLGRLRVPNRSLVLCASALILTTSGGINAPMGWVGMFSIAVLYRNHWSSRNAAVVAASHSVKHTGRQAAMERTPPELFATPLIPSGTP